jgi:cell shape-determining protein MreC
MNLIGKIFVVLIFVMSLVFMSFAIAVYSTHKNWKDYVMNDQAAPDKPLGLIKKFENEQTRNEELKTQLKTLTEERNTAKTAHEQALTKLRTELETATLEKKKLEEGYAALQKSESESVVAMNTTQANATKFREELEKLRGQLLDAWNDRDKHFKEVERKTDELNQALNDNEQLKKRTNDLAKDLAKAKEALRWIGLDENSDYKSKTPPKVDGIVSETPGEGIVVISIGSDAGLRKGHQLEVIRTTGGSSTYVGRVEVIKTTPDKSVCKVDPKYQKAAMMKGDRVFSQID